MNTKIVPCPTCKAPAEFNESNTFRPFCSERCQLIDLGEWFNEERRISGDTSGESSDENYRDNPRKQL